MAAATGGAASPKPLVLNPFYAEDRSKIDPEAENAYISRMQEVYLQTQTQFEHQKAFVENQEKERTSSGEMHQVMFNGLRRRAGSASYLSAKIEDGGN